MVVADPSQDRELLQRFEVQKFLGKGSYGSVFRVRRLSDNKIYALKETNVKHMSAQDRADAVNEIRLLASVRHHHVTNYHEAFVDGNRLCIVMEYAPHGDLARAIRKRAAQQKYFSEDQIWNYLIQICHGLQALHAARILHRDVKTANVLRCAGEIVKLSDLGVAKLMKGAMTKTQIGTPHYMPPEVWKSRPYSFSSDTWALGCVVYELATFTVPFEARSLEELRYRVLRGKYNPLPSFYSQELHQVVRIMLEPEPTSRPSMDELLNLAQVRSRMSLYQKPPSPAQSGYAPSVMLETIKVPKNLRMLGKRLPEPRYPDGPTPGKETNKTAQSWPAQHPQPSAGHLPAINPSVASTSISTPVAARGAGIHRDQYVAVPSHLPQIGKRPSEYSRQLHQQQQRNNQYAQAHGQPRVVKYDPYGRKEIGKASPYGQQSSHYGGGQNYGMQHHQNPYAPSSRAGVYQNIPVPGQYSRGPSSNSSAQGGRYRDNGRQPRIPSSRVQQNLPVPPHRRGLGHYR
mmetsp:Transcript_41658/g.79602  ORF Transcript_41658/g.79602 Transcript_41658/m.79602 type:complete len:516 (+) Transcript_41658:462-2009(+)